MRTYIQSLQTHFRVSRERKYAVRSGAGWELNRSRQKETYVRLPHYVPFKLNLPELLGSV